VAIVALITKLAVGLLEELANLHLLSMFVSPSFCFTGSIAAHSGFFFYLEKMKQQLSCIEESEEQKIIILWGMECLGAPWEQGWPRPAKTNMDILEEQGREKVGYFYTLLIHHQPNNQPPTLNSTIIMYFRI